MVCAADVLKCAHCLSHDLAPDPKERLDKRNHLTHCPRNYFHKPSDSDTLFMITSNGKPSVRLLFVVLVVWATVCRTQLIVCVSVNAMSMSFGSFCTRKQAVNIGKQATEATYTYGVILLARHATGYAKQFFSAAVPSAPLIKGAEKRVPTHAEVCASKCRHRMGDCHEG